MNGTVEEKIANHEAASVQHDGQLAYQRQPFNLLKSDTSRYQKGHNIMAAKKSSSKSLKLVTAPVAPVVVDTVAIEKTAQEIADELAPDYDTREKDAAIAEHLDMVGNHEPGQSLPEDIAEQAASGSGYQGEEVVDTPAVPVEPLPVEKKGKKSRSPKESKPTAHKEKAALSVKDTTKSIVASNGRTYKPVSQWKAPHKLTTEDILGIVADSKAGMKLGDVVKKYNSNPTMVRYILVGKLHSKTTGIVFTPKSK